jgi:hypothetical protein
MKRSNVKKCEKMTKNYDKMSQTEDNTNNNNTTKHNTN